MSLVPHEELAAAHLIYDKRWKTPLIPIWITLGPDCNSSWRAMLGVDSTQRLETSQRV